MVTILTDTGQSTAQSHESDDPFMHLLRTRAIETRARQSIPVHQEQHQDAEWPPRLKKPPSVEEFRRIIDRHVPVLIEACMIDRPGIEKWKDTGYLESRMGDREVSVAITPDGRADDLVKHTEDGQMVFALPLEKNMPFSELLERLANQVRNKSETIAYLQSQNSNLSVTEYGDLSPLLRDLKLQTGVSREFEGDKLLQSDLTWATEALDELPEATNIWIGTSASRTSMHRDYYENLFTVVRGWKEFTVFPPNEGCFLCDDPETEYPAYRYVRASQAQANDEESLRLERDEVQRPTRWIPIDPTLPKHSARNAPYVHRDCDSDQSCAQPIRRHSEQTKYGYALPPLRIRVHEGETLYLPSGWFHHVAQQQDQQLVSLDGQNVDRGLCLCINWWYQISDEMALRLEEMDLAVPS